MILVRVTVEKSISIAVVNKVVRLSNSILYRNSHWKILIYQRLAQSVTVDS